MVATATLQSDYLARLLLIQNMAAMMPEWTSLSEFIASGIREFPGVDTVQFVHEHVDEVVHDKRYVLPLAHDGRDFGGFIMEVHDEAAIKPYLPYIQNMMGMISVILDNRAKSVDMEHEIEQRREAERSLRKLSLAVEQSPNMIIITDTEGVIEYVNPVFTDMTGYSAEEAVGVHIRLLRSGETSQEIYAQMWRTILAGDRWNGELKDKRKDGSVLWVSVSIVPLFDDTNTLTHFVGMHEDITHRKLAEEKIRQAMENAKKANRAKSELLANMSHELRTPLNAIIGFSNSIRDEMFGPVSNDRYVEYAGDIMNSGQHLLDLINDILDLSAVEAGKVQLETELVSLADVVEAALHLVIGRAEQEGVALEAKVPRDLPPVEADGRRLKQILINLLSNAVKFTPAGGRIDVRVERNADGSISLQILDTGIGMDEAELEKAMSEFGQVDSGLNRKHEGTGLGLPLAKSLTELHGGLFDIASEKGRGTSVCVTLPVERVVALDRLG